MAQLRGVLQNGGGIQAAAQPKAQAGVGCEVLAYRLAEQ